MDSPIPSVLIALSLATLALVPAASASDAEAELPGYYVVPGEDGASLWEETNDLDGLQQAPIYDAEGDLIHHADSEVSMATTHGDDIPVCVSKPSPDPKGEEEICLAVVHVPHVCIRDGPDAKADETCLADLIQTPASKDVTVDTTKLSHCVGPWTTETTVDLGTVSVTLITCDPFMGQPPW